MKENKILVIILFVALVIRLAFVYVMPVPLWDETIYSNLGYDLSINPGHYSFDGKWSDFVPDGQWPKAGFRAPLLPYFLSLFYLLRLDFLIAFIMPLIGMLSVLLIYYLGRMMFNEKVGIYSASFLTLIPLHVFYSGRVLTDVFSLFFVLLTIFAFWKGYEEGDRKYKILFGLFFALSVLARYTSLWLGLVFLIYFVWRDKGFRFIRDKYLWYAVALFLLVMLPWFIYGVMVYGSPFGPIIHGMIAGSSYWGGIQGWFWFFVPNRFWEMFSILGAISLLSLGYLGYRKELFDRTHFLLLICLVLFLLLAIVMPHKEDRYVLPIVPALCLFAAVLLSKIRFDKKWMMIFFSLIMLFSCWNLFNSTYNIYHNTNTLCFLETADYLNGINASSVIFSENPPIFRYFVKQENGYYPDTLSVEILRGAERENQKVYFVFTRFDSSFEQEKFLLLKKLLNENYNKKFECSEDREVNFVYSN